MSRKPRRRHSLRGAQVCSNHAAALASFDDQYAMFLASRRRARIPQSWASDSSDSLFRRLQASTAEVGTRGTSKLSPRAFRKAGFARACGEDSCLGSIGFEDAISWSSRHRWIGCAEAFTSASGASGRLSDDQEDRWKMQAESESRGPRRSSREHLVGGREFRENQ